MLRFNLRWQHTQCDWQGGGEVSITAGSGGNATLTLNANSGGNGIIQAAVFRDLIFRTGNTEAMTIDDIHKMSASAPPPPTPNSPSPATSMSPTQPAPSAATSSTKCQPSLAPPPSTTSSWQGLLLPALRVGEHTTTLSVTGASLRPHHRRLQLRSGTRCHD